MRAPPDPISKPSALSIGYAPSRTVRARTEPHALRIRPKQNTSRGVGAGISTRWSRAGPEGGLIDSDVPAAEIELGPRALTLRGGDESLLVCINGSCPDGARTADLARRAQPLA